LKEERIKASTDAEDDVDSQNAAGDCSKSTSHHGVYLRPRHVRQHRSYHQRRLRLQNVHIITRVPRNKEQKTTQAWLRKTKQTEAITNNQKTFKSRLGMCRYVQILWLLCQEALWCSSIFNDNFTAHLLL